MLNRKESDSSGIVPEVGSPAPDFEACDTGGKVTRLSDYWRETPVVVVFLRYFGCTFCRTQLIELRDRYAEFQAAGAQVVCVAMGGDKVGRAFQVMFALPFPLMMLDEGNVRPYKQYGLTQGSLLQLLGPRLFLKGMTALLLLGRRVIDWAQPGDKRQMPGTFVIDQGGIIRLVYRGRDASDNAPPALLLETLEQMRASAA